GGELLSPASLESMTTPSGVTTPDQEPYGLGTFIESDGEHSLVGHTGGIGGYLSYAYYLEPEEVALIVMSNRTPTDLRAASTHALAAVLGIDVVLNLRFSDRDKARCRRLQAGAVSAHVPIEHRPHGVRAPSPARRPRAGTRGRKCAPRRRSRAP